MGVRFLGSLLRSFRLLHIFRETLLVQYPMSTFESAEEIILQWEWDSAVHGEGKLLRIFRGDRSKIDQYLGAVDEIQRWSESATTSDDRSRAIRVSQIAMTQLEYEFEIILSSVTSLIGISLGTDITSSTYSSSITDSTFSFSYVDYDIDYNYSEHGPKIKESISDLRTIAERMNSAGHLRDCVKVYKSVRKSFLDENLRRLRIEKLSIDEVHRLEWGVLEAKIGQFIRAAKICVRILFPSEKQLCEQIFEGLGTGTADACFTEMVKDRAIQLFNFAEAIGRSRRQPQRLFKILWVHDELSDLLPYIDSAFRSKSLRSIFDHAAGILPQLAESARRILLGFENDVLHELSDFVHHGGEIHPMTRYVMNYIISMCVYKETLTKLIISMPSKEENRRYSNDLTILDIEEIAQFERERNPLPAHLIWIIHILQLKLKIKSKSYNDTSLALLFMMNNVHYIVQKIQQSPDLGEMIGDDYLEKLANFVRQGVTAYQTSTWEAIFHCLRDEGANQSRKNCSLGQRLKTFNAMFEEVHRTQATWSVPDLRLRKKLQDSILAELIPAYRYFLECIEKLSIPPSWSFTGWIRNLVRRENQRGIHLNKKYSVEDLQIAVSNFFEGK